MDKMCVLDACKCIKKIFRLAFLLGKDVYNESDNFKYITRFPQYPPI